MKTVFLLMVLTQNGAGDINAAFVNTETQEQCQQKALMLEDVFKTSNIQVIESHCSKSDLRFSPFEHASASSKIQNFYLIYLDDKLAQISVMPDWHTCINKKRKSSKQGRVYCSSSVQSIR